jgi:hypothetical protein
MERGRRRGRGVVGTVVGTVEGVVVDVATVTTGACDEVAPKSPIVDVTAVTAAVGATTEVPVPPEVEPRA